MWKMESTGQALLRPPNVSGWKINGYFVNASAMEARARICQGFNYHARRNFWLDDGSGQRAWIAPHGAPLVMPTRSYAESPGEVIGGLLTPLFHGQD